MYNRYIPNANGTFQRTVVDDRPSQPPPRPSQPEPLREERPCPPPEKPKEADCEAAQVCAERGSEHFLRKLLPHGIDIGELLALLIVLLLLVDSEEDDTLTVLVTIAAFLLL